MRLVPSPRHLPPMALAFGDTSYGTGPLPSPCSCPLLAPNQAGYSPHTSLGIVGISGGCMSPGFPPHAILLRRSQSPVAGEDCIGQVVDHCQLGRGETCVELGGISLWQENQSHKHMVIQP